MDFEDIPTNPQTMRDYRKIFAAFSKAIDENNDDIINLIISINGILEFHFTWDQVPLISVVAQRGSVKTAAQMCNIGLNLNSVNRKYQTPIFYAIRHSVDMVKLFLNHGASLNVKCRRGVSPLHEALLIGTEDIVQVMLQKIFADKQNENNVPLITVQNSEDIVKALLQYKSDLHLKVTDYPLLIFYAARMGNTKLFNLTLDDCRKYLESTKDRQSEDGKNESKETNVARPPEELNFQGYYGRTALHYAVREGLPEVICFLLEAGADVNCKTNYDFTPLHYAVILENEEICQILLTFGAEVNPSLSNSPLYLACGRSEARDHLDSESGYYYKALHCFPLIDHHYYRRLDATINPRIMKLLLQIGANTEIPGYQKMTPLLEACRNGRLDILKMLLEFKANIAARDEYNSSALHHAAFSNNIEIVEFLLEKGFYIEEKNHERNTPFLFAVNNERRICVEMIEYLADHGANINARNFHGDTGLTIVSSFMWTDVIECLLALGANYKMERATETYTPFFPNVTFQRDLSSFHYELTAFIAIKEEVLGDYISSYISFEGIFGYHKKLEIHNYFKNCKLALSKMKSTKIVENCRYSFHDFLASNIYSAVMIMQNEQVRIVFTSDKYKKENLYYQYLLEKRFQRVVSLENIVQETFDFIQNCGKFKLPILVVDNILRFLSPSDFRVFGRVLSERSR